MRNLRTRIVELREQVEEKYLAGDKRGALKDSLRLDKLVAMAQREQMLESEMAGGDLRMIAAQECEQFPPLYAVTHSRSRKR